MNPYACAELNQTTFCRKGLEILNRASALHEDSKVESFLQGIMQEVSVERYLL